MSLRFHLDEHIPSAVGQGLRRRGIDVTTTGEAGLAGIPDEQQLKFASREQRVMVTHDGDFLRLHRGGLPHAGIVYCKQGTPAIGEILHGLIFIHDLMTAQEMAGQVVYL
ncbi:MAG: DUF5615 family PIN-like protein [Acidobacteria bacterium]|nr:DUF5615 family PIN-like protein [Acidobacteriota bacterium]